MNPFPPAYPFSRNSNHQTNFNTASLPSDGVGARAWLARHSFSGIIRHAALLALVTAVVLRAGPAQAANLLVNPSFEQNSGHIIPTGWTRFAPPTAQAARQLLDRRRLSRPQVRLTLFQGMGRLLQRHEQCRGHIPGPEQRAWLGLSSQRMVLHKGQRRAGRRLLRLD